MNSGTLRIGEVAALSSVSIDAVRYYERRKLLPRANRTEGGFRLFPPDTIARVRFIKQAQDLGLSLDEIGGLLATGGSNECRRVRNLLRLKIEELDERMRTMREFRRTLSHHLGECENELEIRGSKSQCPVFLDISGTRMKKDVK